MKEQKSIITEIKNLIEKVKRQDPKFGQYLEDHIVLSEKSGRIVYLGKLISEVPHLPITVGE